jgi:hypothetical protein
LFGPTELRILLVVGTLALLRSPYATVFGHRLLLFDWAGRLRRWDGRDRGGGRGAAYGGAVPAGAAASTWRHRADERNRRGVFRDSADAAREANAIFCFVLRNPVVTGSMLNHATYKNPAVLSHHAMRRMVGIIALLLPFVLVPAGTILLSLLGPSHALPHPLLQRSISDYRWTSMRDCQVGGLCAIAAFPDVLSGIRLDR